MSMRPWREGVATKRGGGSGWAWVVGYLGMGAGSGAAARYEDGLWWLTVGAVVALWAGIAWFLLYPRNLADRLALLTGVFLLAMLVAAIPGAVLDGEARPTTVVGFLGVLSGLIVGEHWSRYRDARGRAAKVDVGDPH